MIEVAGEYGSKLDSVNYHCLKSFRIRSYSGPYFPAFGLSMERYGVSLHTHSECGKMQSKITSNTDTFHAVYVCKNLHHRCPK